MTYKTHLIGGAQAGILLAYACCDTPTESAIVLGSAVIGSVLPDIDYTKSKICNSDLLVKTTSYALSRFTKHRGLTHTLLGALIFGLLFFMGATYKDPGQNVFAIYAAIATFFLMHIIGGLPGKAGALLSVAMYLAGPDILALIRGRSIDFTLDSDTARLCAFGIMGGCISHMIYDTFNSAGIMWLYPINRKTLSLAAIKTRSHSEALFAAVQVVILAILLAACFQELYVIDATRNFINHMSELVSGT